MICSAAIVAYSCGGRLAYGTAIAGSTTAQKAALLMERPVWNRELLDELSQAMRDASICGLGQAASNPLTSVIKYFPEEFVPKEAAE